MLTNERIKKLRGYQALQVTMLLVVMVKACLYSNDRFVDSILSIIDLMRVNFECVK